MAHSALAVRRAPGSQQSVRAKGARCQEDRGRWVSGGPRALGVRRAEGAGCHKGRGR